MNIECTLIINDDGKLRVVKKHPHWGPFSKTEVAIPLTIDLPDGWFGTRTKIVTIDVPAPLDRGNVLIEIDEVSTGVPSAVLDLSDHEGVATCAI